MSKIKADLNVKFYKEEKFKETPIGKIPEDWEIVRLEKIISICQNGIWGYDPIPSEESYPVIRSTEITYDGKIDLSTVAFRRIPKEKVNQYALQDGDILIVGSSGSRHLIGRSALFFHPNDGRRYLFSNFMIRIRPRDTDPKFLHYFLNSTLYFNFLKSLQQTSTGLRNLQKKKLLRVNIPYPPFQEQKAIAYILSTVDDAIQKTNEIIEKTERLKKGLMQELLTKGIGHKEFKDTEIGRIPKEWEAVRLGKVVEIYDHKRIPLSEQERVNRKGPYPYCGATGIIDYINGYIFDGEYILLAEDGGYFGPFEQSAYIMSGKFWVNNHAHVLKARDDVANNWYLMYFLNYIDLRPYIVGSTRAKLNQSDMRGIVISLPPLEEQQKIVEILSTVDKRLEIERKRKEKLERIKKALMDLLLTGKIRVKI